MLIEFSVTNFRSFREKQTFSMVAAPRLRKRENVFKPAVKGEKLPDLLKVAAIYGPNASGKSNLIRALDVVREVASRQPSAQPIPLPVTPFRFDPQLRLSPSRIELHFVHAEQRYQFELALTQDRIVEERLISFPAGKETMLYERLYRTSGETYRFGSSLEGGDGLHEVWRNSTSPQVLFITQAVANSSEELTQLRLPFRWLQKGLMVVTGSMESWASASQKLAEEHSFFAEQISSFLQDVDVPVTKIRFDKLESANLGLLGALIESKPKSKMVLVHQTALGEGEFDFNDESDGTKNLIGFWLPWRVHSQSGHAKENFTLVVDELDSSLHPEIVKSLVDKHLKSDMSAQLIFTTHDTHLMDTKLLRRDQFWLTERDANGATQLRSIHDFEGREGEDLEKRYYEGRYRALPIIRRS
ncbi:AAA family ATPase [Methylomonas fluvii]|uniref:ATP-binding protein n=1 Tax=Methylomonas fluvii TaxID=1854564 RepID=A0ABR9DJV9_9GAMM|nr:ATP-binding protein [Methylomonas fluvii]MBD9362167.1 ATP-binding protein [Methylomonas fluvii]